MKKKGKSERAGAPAFKIEKGIAIPPKQAIGALSPTARTMLDLDVNDSFVVTDKKPETVMGAVRAMNARMRKQKRAVEFTGRRTTDGVRVWRVK